MNIAEVRKLCYLDIGCFIPHCVTRSGTPLAKDLKKQFNEKLKAPVGEVWYEVGMPLLHQLLEGER